MFERATRKARLTAEGAKVAERTPGEEDKIGQEVHGEDEGGQKRWYRRVTATSEAKSPHPELADGDRSFGKVEGWRGPQTY